MTSTSSLSFSDMLREALSLLCVMAFYGPPVLFIAIPWLLFGLMLMGPFTVLLTLAAALLAAAAVVAGAAALVAAPIVLVRRWRAQTRSVRVHKPVHQAGAHVVTAEAAWKAPGSFRAVRGS
jgi:hypothetical protein